MENKASRNNISLYIFVFSINNNSTAFLSVHANFNYLPEKYK